MAPIWIPLQGPAGERPKAPKVAGWQSPSYQGVDPSLASVGDWLGLRCDDLVVVDCDSQDAAEFWEKHVGAKGMAGVWCRKTPRGFHYIYEHTPGAPTGPSVAIFPGIDIRAGRTSQIVFHADGYKNITSTELSGRYGG